MRKVDVWEYVNKTDTCWLWTGPLNPKGYGAFKGTLAHKFVYELLKGKVPEGLVLDHIVCENRKCVNPDHVSPVTNYENTMRGDGPAAQNARKEFCKRGHPFNGSNVRIEQGRYGRVRRCLTCKLQGRR